MSTPKTVESTAAASTSKSRFFVFLFVFVDILGFSIVLPLFPYWRELFAASPTAVGLLGTANALAQLIAGTCLYDVVAFFFFFLLTHVAHCFD
jgi:hypothetical protein